MHIIRSGARALSLAALFLMVFLSGCPRSKPTVSPRPSAAPPVHAQEHVRAKPTPVASEPAAKLVPVEKPAPAKQPTKTLTLGELLEQAGERLAKQLTPKVPAGKAVAVLPLVDSDGGLRRLGVVLADNLERPLLEGGATLVDRRHLDKVLDEIDIRLVASGDAEAVKKAARLAKADILIVGRTVSTGQEVLISARAMRVGGGTGRVVAVAGEASLPRDRLGELMWYVRRPDHAGPGAELPPLSLRYEFVSPSPLGPVRLAEGDVVRSDQKFKIRIRPNSDCFLYVLLYDSRGAASVLFPHSDIALSNAVRGDTTAEIPEAGKWYWFDENSGEETFYVVASYTPLDNLAWMLRKLRGDGSDTELTEQAKQEIEIVLTRGMKSAGSTKYTPKGFEILSRGVGGVVEARQSDREGRTGPPEEVVTGLATVVRKVTLQHR